MDFVDLRSDTVTRPTEEMRLAMQNTEVGDDVYGEDPVTNALESLAARLTGKEAALLVASGTMGNQVSIMAHTHPGDEMIAERRSHIVHHEAGGAARLSGVGYALTDNPDQVTKPSDIEKLVRPAGDVHYPRSRLLCLENALSNGNVVSLGQMKELYETARRYGLVVHLDGARIFNAAQALGTTVGEIAAYADSVMFCVSKGLCAPVGSLVCGSTDFIAEARRCRKVLGGGMRQTGVLAACGMIALEKMTARLREDHENALYLGKLLSEIPGIDVEMDHIKINMVFWRAGVPGFDPNAFVSFMMERKIKINPMDDGVFRFVTHHDVSTADVEKVAECVNSYALSLPKDRLQN